MLNNMNVYEEEAGEYFAAMENVRTVSFASVYFFLLVFFEWLFMYKTKRHYNLFNMRNVTRTVFFWVIFAVSIRHFTTYRIGIGEAGDPEREERYYVKIFIETDEE